MRILLPRNEIVCLTGLAGGGGILAQCFCAKIFTLALGQK
jgi:hypothetical protein